MQLSICIFVIVASCVSLQERLSETVAQIEARYGKSISSEKGAEGDVIYRQYKHDDLNIYVLFVGGGSHREQYSKVNGNKLSDQETANLLDLNTSGSRIWVPVNQASLDSNKREWALMAKNGCLEKAYYTKSGSLIINEHQIDRHVQHKLPSLLEDLIKSDEIVCVAAEDLTVTKDVTHGLAGVTMFITAKKPIAIRGNPGDQIRFETKGLDINIQKARYDLIFLKKNGDQQAMTGTIIGFDQDLPAFDSKFDTATGTYELIKQMFLAERSVACSLREALLLAEAPPSMLSGISKQVIDYSKVDGSSRKHE